MQRRVYPDLATYIRDNDGLTQAELARELGISESFLSMIKSRERQPTLPLALKISARCHVPLESLLQKVG